MSQRYGEAEATLAGLLTALQGLKVADDATPHSEVSHDVQKVRVDVWRIVAALADGVLAANA